ncbi:MAG: glutamate mutase L [Burkholderiaceae bacterium]|nr:glutamate mutase L [Burkholderiaceae bacterium]
MHPASILIDIGSTYTKAVAVDLERETIIAATRAPTTADTDVRIGIGRVLRSLEPVVGRIDGSNVIACSSAAGGLRMVSVGLVPELSAEAARRAALGAGAKIVGHFSHRLGSREIAAIADMKPDMVLLAGGTDGGNESTIVHNARMLARGGGKAPVVVAGNRCTHDEIEAVFVDAGVTYRLVANVMPTVGTLEVDDCRMAIRDLFIENIVRAKGLDEAMQLIGGIVMATPAAVLTAAHLLGSGCSGEAGLGDIVVVDVGGATTDVYSIARGTPVNPAVTVRGLPEPFAKRTVEGDLGVRHNIDALAELCRTQGREIDDRIVAAFRSDKERLPQDDVERAVDAELARVAVQSSFERHVGHVERVFGPHGEMLVQKGKDLTRVGAAVGTGGPIIHCGDPAGALRGVLAGSGDRRFLKPDSADLYLDHAYVMFAMGLLARSEPAIALRMMKRQLRRL